MLKRNAAEVSTSRQREKYRGGTEHNAAGDSGMPRSISVCRDVQTYRGNPDGIAAKSESLPHTIADCGKIFRFAAIQKIFATS